MKPVLLYIALIVIPLFTHGQSAQEKFLERGKAWMEVHEYQKAIESYKQAMEWGANEEILAGIAKACKHLHRPEKALEYYRRLKDQSPEYLFDYAVMLKRTGKYKKAQQATDRFLNHYPDHKNALHQKAALDSVFRWKAAEPNYSIKSLSKINSPSTDVAPVTHSKGIVFSSNREGTVIKKKINKAGDPHFDLFLANGEKQSLHKPIPFSGAINTLRNEGAACFSSNEETIYFTRSEQRGGSDQVKRLKLYKSEKNFLGWSKPLIFYMNDTSSSFGHPWISQDQSLFFFASDMPGGYGGTDLYFCIRKDSVWSDPRNLGPEVNTAGNELYPFLREQEGKLYFASNGHHGMGGFDLFRAKVINGRFRKVRNMRPPINSPGDDLSITFIEDSTNTPKGYFSSNRQGGKGREDIYYFEGEE